MYNYKQITLWLLTLLLCAGGCSQRVSKKENTMINWTKLPDLPGAADTASLGVSAPFVGMSNGKLIVAGGCNFPDKPVTEGGAKRYYSELFVLLADGWKEAGQLPYPVAYGASVTTPNGIVCIGGNNNDSSLMRVSLISYHPESGRIETRALPSLPNPMDNLSAAGIGNDIYVAGGNEQGKPCNAFLHLDASNLEKGWQRLPDFPDASRVQPVLAIQQTPQGPAVFLAGGFQPLMGDNPPVVPTEVWAYHPQAGAWKEETTLPAFQDGTQRTLTGGCAVAFGDSAILFMGGVNRDRFVNALARPLEIAKAEATGDTATLDSLRAEAKAYMHHPIEWYQFNTALLQYNTFTKEWSNLGEYEQLARAGAGAVIDGNKLIVVNGELKPGIRTPQVNQGDL